MDDPVDLALRREVRRAIAETLQQENALHPCLPINKAVGLAMSRAHIDPEGRSTVVQAVCREGLRQRLVLEFG
jgi:hypothetical protein